MECLRHSAEFNKENKNTTGVKTTYSVVFVPVHLVVKGEEVKVPPAAVKGVKGGNVLPYLPFSK